MTSTPPGPKQVVRAASGDDDAFLHDQYIGSFPSELQAWTELNCVHFEHGRSSTARTAIEPVDDATPVPTISDHAPHVLLPVSVAALEAAATRLRPDPAIHKALKRLLEGGWSCHENDTLVITFDPRSRGRSGKLARPYTTTATSCTCPGAVIRGGCYHPVAWQVVSEARTPTTALQWTLPSAMFLPLALLVLSCGCEFVTLRVDSGQGTLTLHAADGATGTLRVEIAAPVQLVIEQQFCAADLKRLIDSLADVLPPHGDQLLLEADESTLMIVAGTEDAPTFVDGLLALPADASTTPFA